MPESVCSAEFSVYYAYKAERQVSDLEYQWEAKFRQMHQKLSGDLQESTHRLQSDKSAAEMMYSQQLQEAESRWVTEKVAVEKRWTEEKAETERRFQLVMDETRQHWKNEKVRGHPSILPNLVLRMRLRCFANITYNCRVVHYYQTMFYESKGKTQFYRDWSDVHSQQISNPNFKTCVPLSLTKDAIMC
eukprot:scaffold96337_cov48-Prasinocladus_malaysianus.AAC.2